MDIYGRALNKAALRKHTIRPKKRNPKAGQRPIAFLFGRDGSDLNRIPKNGVVWSLTSFRQLLVEHDEADIIVFKKGNKRGIVGAQVVGGPKIRRGYERPISLNLDEYLAGYYWVNDYLASHGISFTSSSWASEQAFRLGFKKPLTVSNPIGKHLLRPSRGVCYPGQTYKGLMEKWDIRSAYPYAMLDHAATFPAKCVPIEPNEWNARKNTLTLARVTVRPSIPISQLPVIQIHPTDTINQREYIGWFWKFELETIADQWHSIEPIISFKVSTADLSDEVGAWLEILSPRYGDIGYAGKILKSIANALWGSFAAGDVHAYTWSLDQFGNASTDKHLRRTFGGKLGAEHVAAWNNALVSDRTFKEFIEPETVLYFDTDGGFCRPTADSLGNGDFGQWRFEGHYRKLEVVDWQAYAAWHDNGVDVTLSGVPDATYKDLKRYGNSETRNQYLSMLMEDDPFSQVAAVHLKQDKVATIPKTIAELSPQEWAYIEPEVAPHISHVNGQRGQDFIPVTGKQAAAFRELSNLKLDFPDDDAIVTDVPITRKEGTPNGNQGNYTQGKFDFRGEAPNV